MICFYSAFPKVTEAQDLNSSSSAHAWSSTPASACFSGTNVWAIRRRLPVSQRHRRPHQRAARRALGAARRASARFSLERVGFHLPGQLLTPYKGAQSPRLPILPHCRGGEGNHTPLLFRFFHIVEGGKAITRPSSSESYFPNRLVHFPICLVHSPNPLVHSG